MVHSQMNLSSMASLSLPVCCLLLILLLEASEHVVLARSVGGANVNENTSRTLLSSSSSSSTAREPHEIGDCLPGTDTRDTCEKCAKSTRAMLAYPLCCAGSVNVRNWCQEFLSYTLKE